MSTPSARDRVLVTGATGTHGGAVAQALLASGRRVRALTRDPRGGQARRLGELGAELVAGDLLDDESLQAATTGMAAVYAVTTPFGHEQQLRSLGVPHTVVAPAYFYENLGDPADAIAGGELTLSLPASRPLQQVALADLGALVVALLDRRQEFLGERIEVAGDQPTPQQMADALSVAGGRPVHYRRIALEQVAARSGDLAAMYRFLEQTGYGVDLSALQRRFPEVAWSTFAAWAQQGATAR